MKAQLKPHNLFCIANSFTYMKTKTIFSVLAVAFLVTGKVVAQSPCLVTPSSDKNYIITETMIKEESNEANLNALKTPDKLTAVQYLDGLGRPLQTVVVNASPQLKNSVTFNAYDNFGRENKVYLPYTSATGCGTYIANAPTEQSNFYKTATNIELSDYPVAETAYELSSLNRITAQGAAGADWQLSNNHTVKYDYGTNISQEVRNFILYATSTSFYGVGTLSKKIIKDENWVVADAKNGTTEEFTDVEGHVVLKRNYTNNQILNTYYLYNTYGSLAYVIPPLASDILETAIPSTTTALLNNLCYQYGYDSYNRLVKKKLPGKDWEYIVYDQLDRPVFKQDGNQRLLNKWIFTKYDAFGKVACTGVYNSNATKETLQNILDSKAPGIVAGGGTLYPLYETRISTPLTIDGKAIYYSNTAFPTSNIQLLTINYYDDYAFDTDGLTIPATVYTAPVTTQLTGMLTGTKVRVLTDVLTPFWNTTLVAYDKKARSIFTSTRNQYIGYTEQKEINMDFSGKVRETKSTHTKGNLAPIVVIDRMNYDYSGRLSNHTKKVNNEEEQLIGANVYNERDQLTTKTLGNVTSLYPLQTIDYAYNIRGWLKQVNNPAALASDLFAYTLNYNTTQLTGSKALYNGNISETGWKTSNDNLLRSYNYQYDKVNRITAANSLNTDAGKFTNSAISYDKNGNLLTLNRNGWQNSATYTNLDVLSYIYDGNKLLAVTDAGNKKYGFIDGDSTGNDYVYDANGNLTKDRNKKINSIVYNLFNLPQKLIFNLSPEQPGILGTITYAYDANGVKQSKTSVKTGPGRYIPLSVQYAGNFVYEGEPGYESLQYFSQEEGYIRPINTGSQTAYQYVYQYKDQLGNNRLSYANDATGHLTIIEESNYDAFGLKHQGYNNVISSLGNSRAQGLKYNGKELQEDYGFNCYDYGARFYDPAIGRWSVVDPLGEKFISYTPYNYCVNNPVNGIDPDGRLSKSFIDDVWNKSGEGNTKWENKGDGNFTGSNGESVGGDDKKPDKNKKEVNKDDEKKSQQANPGALVLPLAGTQPELMPIVAPVTGWVIGDYLGKNLESVCENVATFLVYIGVSREILYGPDEFSAEHTKGARPSTKGKHEEGQARRGRDRGGEKGDAGRRPPNVRPKNWKGKWPPQ